MAQRPQCHPNLRAQVGGAQTIPTEGIEPVVGSGQSQNDAAGTPTSQPGAADPASQSAGVGSEPEQPTADPAA